MAAIILFLLWRLDLAPKNTQCFCEALAVAFHNLRKGQPLFCEAFKKAVPDLPGLVCHVQRHHPLDGPTFLAT